MQYRVVGFVSFVGGAGGHLEGARGRREERKEERELVDFTFRSLLSFLSLSFSGRMNTRSLKPSERRFFRYRPLLYWWNIEGTTELDVHRSIHLLPSFSARPLSPRPCSDFFSWVWTRRRTSQLPSQRPRKAYSPHSSAVPGVVHRRVRRADEEGRGRRPR